MAVTSYAYPTSVVAIENSQIASGSGFKGGGLKIELENEVYGGGKPNILVKNVHFIDNTAMEGGGALYVTANQTKFNKTRAAVHIQNCTFTKMEIPAPTG